MSRLILFVVALSASPLAAQTGAWQKLMTRDTTVPSPWVLQAERPDAVQELDTTRIVWAADTVSFWLRDTYREPLSRLGMVYDQIERRWHIRCEAREIGLSTMIIALDGEIAFDDTIEPSFTQIDPASDFRHYHARFCTSPTGSTLPIRDIVANASTREALAPA